MMAASRSVAGLLLLHLFTRCAADAVAGGPVQSPSAGGAGPPRTASIAIEDIKDTEDIDVDFPAQQPSVLSGEPGAYGVPAPSPTSGPPPIPAQLEPEEGDLRLVRQVESDLTGFVYGALQVFLGGEFGAVCTNRFGPTDADVACRQMGFVGGVSITSQGNRFQLVQDLELDVLAPIVLDSLNCTGTEERLVDCPGATEPYPDYKYYYTDLAGGCNSLAAQFAFVACGTLQGPEDGDLRLGPGGVSEDGNAQYGRLEVFANGGWGLVCDRIDSFPRPSGFRGLRPFSDAAVAVACKQLGFQAGEKAVVGQAALLDAPPAEGQPFPFLLDATNCNGMEDRLVDCRGAKLGGGADFPGRSSLQCSETTDGSGGSLDLVCFNSTDSAMAEDGDLRLMEGQAGPGFEYGRLEIFLRRVWRTVCDGGFTPASAKVACTLLGFDGGALIQGLELPSALPAGVDVVNCNGNESSLLQCPSVSSAADISQKDNTMFPQTCRSTTAGFTSSSVVACGQTSASCLTPPPVQGSVRLRGGVGTPCDPVHTGNVEVFNDGEWGAICINNFFEVPAANVICRQLGFPHGSTEFWFQQDQELDPEQRFWLSQVNCNGPEARLLDCALGAGFRDGNAGCLRNPVRLRVACRSFPIGEAESITTPGAEEGNMRLVQQTAVANWEIGSLQLFSSGFWGRVCGNTFTASDAKVACRTMGYVSGALWPTKLNGRPPRPTPGPDQLMPPDKPQVALAGSPGCTGSEQTILECSNAGTAGTPFASLDGCRQFDDSEDAGIVIACATTEEIGTEGDLRLVGAGIDGNDPAAGVGILEIFHAGAWGTVCNGDPRVGLDYGDYYGDNVLTVEAAMVACRQLGFEAGEFRSLGKGLNPSLKVQSIFDEVPLSPAWLADVPCAGTEDTLLECGDLSFGDTASCGFSQRLVCSNGAQEFPFLTPRLVDGDEDPGGAWAYGRLEVFDGETFVLVSDVKGLDSNQELGRREVIVACRDLGFATGGQALAGATSALPDEGRDSSVGTFTCSGDEATLKDCDLDTDRTSNADYNYVVFVENTAVALVCYNPSDCTPVSASAAPVQGDIRLVNLEGVDFGTQPCDDVHIGAVEFFNDGRWGRLCGDGNMMNGWAVDAMVICRQLGFPYGNLVDPAGGRSFDAVQPPAWASRVFCTGTEERLADCNFPDSPGDILQAQPGGCLDDFTLTVMCRRFPMAESDFIRRL